ncbi:hypothetical protein IZT72_29175 [Pseudomonas brenneri]|jgi:hypothetical protein|uniref:hypothetical protein n=1 Tax=Pseudomonas brenneri TaxID=129817 RepID=UPI0018A2AAFC|nr:hypothetical protein [Pseudomonas brenneri]MBF8008663.1 hypothetical protein [Pseudomonas brenneri]
MNKEELLIIKEYLETERDNLENHPNYHNSMKMLNRWEFLQSEWERVLREIYKQK